MNRDLLRIIEDVKSQERENRVIDGLQSVLEVTRNNPSDKSLKAPDSSDGRNPLCRLTLVRLTTVDAMRRLTKAVVKLMAGRTLFHQLPATPDDSTVSKVAIDQAKIIIVVEQRPEMHTIRP